MKTINGIHYSHIGTRNGSFLRVRKQLMDMKINNHSFFLTLTDMALRDIDPYNPNLSDDMKKRIIEECRNNFWYYLREVYRVPSVIGEGSSQFILHRGSLAMLYMALNDIDVYAELPRQTGLTVATTALATWEMLFDEGKHYAVAGVTADANLQLYKINAAIKALPEYVQKVRAFEVEDKRFSSSDVTHDNIIFSVGEANTEHKAEESYRIKNYNTIIMDHFTHLKFNDIILNESQNVRKIILSQVGEFETPEEEFAKEVIANAIPFHETFYDQYIENLQHIIKVTSRSNNMVYVRYDFPEIEVSEELFEQMCVMLNYNVKAINKELLLIRQYTPEQAARKKLRDLKVSRELQERLKTQFRG